MVGFTDGGFSKRKMEIQTQVTKAVQALLKYTANSKTKAAEELIEEELKFWLVFGLVKMGDRQRVKPVAM